MTKRGRTKGSGGRGSARSRKPNSRPIPAEIHRLLDSLDAAMLVGNLQQAEAAATQLFARRAQAADALAQRLIDGRARIPFIAFQFLEGFGGTRATAHLRRIASDPRAPDIVRWGAHRLGWPAEAEGRTRLKFLASLRDPEATLVEAIVQGCEWSPPESEILQEVVDYLVALPSEQRLSVLEQGLARETGDIAWLLRALLHLDDPGVQRLAISELVRLHERAAIGALSRLAQTTANPDLRAEADAAIRRLQLDVIGGRGARSDPQVWPAADHIVMTGVDGDGGQAVTLTRRSRFGMTTAVNVFANDGWGIKDVYGVTRASGEGFTEYILEGFEEQDLALIEVDAESVRGAMVLALEANAASGHPVPPAYELWEPFLHDAFPPADDEPVAIPELDEAPYAGHMDLVRSSAELLEHPLFSAWIFDPEEVLTLLQLVPGPGRRATRMTDRQYRPMIKALVDNATCERFRRRLRRQAWLLDRLGDEEERDVALAVAASLAGKGDLTANVFLRAMIEVSVENALAALFAG